VLHIMNALKAAGHLCTAATCVGDGWSCYGRLRETRNLEQNRMQWGIALNPVREVEERSYSLDVDHLMTACSESHNVWPLVLALTTKG
jgi:hypothetical protein